MAAVTVRFAVGSVDDIEGVLDAGVGQQRDGRLTVSPQSRGRGMTFQALPLILDHRQQFGPAAQPAVGQALGESQHRGLKT